MKDRSSRLLDALITGVTALGVGWCLWPGSGAWELLATTEPEIVAQQPIVLASVAVTPLPEAPEPIVEPPAMPEPKPEPVTPEPPEKLEPPPAPIPPKPEPAVAAKPEPPPAAMEPARETGRDAETSQAGLATEAVTQEKPEKTNPEPQAVAGLEAVSIDAATLRNGEKRLREGRFPRMSGSSVRMGFAAYRDAMLALGGRFYLFDRAASRPVAEVDPRTGAITSESVRAGLSPWPRDVTGELQDVLGKGQKRFGNRVTNVVLLPPTGVDAALIGGLDRELRRRGLDPERVVFAHVEYDLRSGRLEGEITQLRLAGEALREIQIRIALSNSITRSAKVAS